MQRFFIKRGSERRIRPITYSSVNNTVNVKSTAIEAEEEKGKTMENLEKLKSVIGANAKVPSRKIKKEKKDKGLIERTEESTILITEDNKMLLND